MVSIQHTLTPEIKDLGGFQARRLLSSDRQSMVGPFIFFDHLGPATFPPGKGVDVRPHPHINLATVTYLFEGALLHRDSLGTVQEIQPGAVNWMTAGRGIVHSERTPEYVRHSEARLHAIQTWVALPEEHEETDPWFGHHPAETLPTWESGGAHIKLIAGAVDGYTSPVQTFSPMLYLDIQFPNGGEYTLPAAYAEQAVYSVTPGLTLAETPLAEHQLAVLTPGQSVAIAGTPGSRCVIVGGAPSAPD